MQLNGTTLTQTARPLAPPIDLEAGKPEPRAVLLLGGVIVAALLLAGLGGLICAWSLPEYGQPTGLQSFGAVLGGVLCVASLVVAGALAWVVVGGWLGHQRRVGDWHAAALEAYAAQGGQEVAQSYTEWSLRADQPRDVLLAALWCWWRVQHGDSAPWSVRSLTSGPLFFGDDQHQRLIGEVSKPDAEKLGAVLAELGFIQGRKEGSAGRWVETDPRRIFEKVGRL